MVAMITQGIFEEGRKMCLRRLIPKVACSWRFCGRAERGARLQHIEFLGRRLNVGTPAPSAKSITSRKYCEAAQPPIRYAVHMFCKITLLLTYFGPAHVDMLQHDIL